MERRQEGTSERQGPLSKAFCVARSSRVLGKVWSRLRYSSGLKRGIRVTALGLGFRIYISSSGIRGKWYFSGFRFFVNIVDSLSGL